MNREMKKLFSVILLTSFSFALSQQISFYDLLALEKKKQDEFIKDISLLFYEEKGFELIKMDEVTERPLCYSYFLTNEEPFTFVFNPCEEESNKILIFSNSSILYNNYLSIVKQIGEYVALTKLGDSDFDLYIYKISDNLQVEFSKVPDEEYEFIYLVRLYFWKQ